MKMMNPDNYRSLPPALLEIIHRHECMVGGEVAVDWRTLASYRHGQEHEDMAAEARVRQIIARAAAEKITVYQDQSQARGRVYYSALMAMPEHKFLDLLYEVYCAGQSSGLNSLRDMVKP